MTGTPRNKRPLGCGGKTVGGVKRVEGVGKLKERGPNKVPVIWLIFLGHEVKQRNLQPALKKKRQKLRLTEDVDKRVTKGGKTGKTACQAGTQG